MTKSNDTLTIWDSIRNSAIGLAIFAFFTAGIISGTHLLTKQTIETNEQAFEARLLLSLLPEHFEAEQVLSSAETFAKTGLAPKNLLNVDPSETYYLLKNADGQAEIVILPVIAPEGYTEAIRLVVGISVANERVIGVRVTKHKETPGLGDRIDITKSDWIYSFNNKSLNDPSPDNWKVKKDGGAFDQMTGATITPRAIVKAVKQSLEFFQQNRTVFTDSE